MSSSNSIPIRWLSELNDMLPIDDDAVECMTDKQRALLKRLEQGRCWCRTDGDVHSERHGDPIA